MRDDRSIWKRKPLTAAAWLAGVVGVWALGLYGAGWAMNGGIDRLTGYSESTPAALPSVDVIDGDTLRVGGETIRISNIDAPETGERARCWAEAALGVASTNSLRQLTGSGMASFSLRREGEDRYGRTLARVTVNGQDVGEQMIALGVAAPWTGRRWTWCDPVDRSKPGAADLARGIKQANDLGRGVLSAEAVDALPGS